MLIKMTHPMHGEIHVIDEMQLNYALNAGWERADYEVEYIKDSASLPDSPPEHEEIVPEAPIKRRGRPRKEYKEYTEQYNDLGA
jgi:hypothetical protein